MNRISLAFIFILLVGILCAGEYLYVEKTVDKYTKDLNVIQAALEKGEREKALMLSKESDKEWEEDSGKIDILLFHDYVDDIGEDMCTIKKYIENENDEEAIVVCERAKRELRSLYESELPAAKNII